MVNHQHPRHVGRRQLLKGIGATALAAPFLRAERAHAAPTPPNLVVVTWPEGLETGWQPTGASDAYQFQDMLAPLNPYRSKLTVLNGIKGGTSNIILQHSEGTLSMWTGDVPGPFQDLATRPSFDQLIAEAIGGSTPYRSLHFGCQTNAKSVISTPYVHYAGNRQPIPAEDDPGAMYKLIFGGSLGGGQDAATLDRLRAERKSVLDFLTGRLRSLRPQVAAEDRPKLDKHEEAVRSLERGLDGLGATCGAKLAVPTSTGAAAMTDANFPAVIKLQTDLMATALQCGLTRVATLQMSNTDSQTVIPNIGTKRRVHEAMHQGTRDERLEVHRFFGKQLAYVLERLSAVDVGGGRTLLDDTLVVMSSEMAVGTHWNEPIPFLLAGNGAGYLKMGRYLQLADKPRHTKVLTSILRAYGRNVQTFGGFTGADAEGELAALKA